MQKQLAFGWKQSDSIVRNLAQINAVAQTLEVKNTYKRSVYTATFDNVDCVIVHNATRLGIDDVNVTFNAALFASKAAAIRFYRKLKAALS